MTCHGRASGLTGILVEALVWPSADDAEGSEDIGGEIGVCWRSRGGWVEFLGLFKRLAFSCRLESRAERSVEVC
jgi:hypothetical protein